MNIDTGEIRSFEEVNQLPKEQQVRFVQITGKQHKLLMGMNRKERRAYYKQNRKGIFQGKSWEEINNQQ